MTKHLFKTTAVEKIILKHYKPTKRQYRNRGWEQCGNEIRSLINAKIDKVKATQRYNNSTYSKQIELENKAKVEVMSEYESYFSNGWGYDWVNGNSSLKELIENNTKKVCTV